MLKLLTNSKILAIGLVITFLSISSLTMANGMRMDDMGSMSKCMFMDQGWTCQMTITQHIAQWEQMFAGISNSDVLMFFLASLPLILAISVFKYTGIDPPLLYTYKRLVKENFQLKLLNNFLHAFSKGIIHPRLYA